MTQRDDKTPVEAQCSDCGRPTARMSQWAIDRGGANRDPGEALCGSCCSHRTVLIRRVDALPKTLAAIRAKQRTGGY